MAAKKQEVKKMTKAEQMAATIRGVSDELKPIIGAGELQLFVKTTTVSDFLSKLATLEALTQKHGDEYKSERGLALELYDEDGQLYFDPSNQDEMKYLHDLPYIIRLKIGEAVGVVNGGVSLPKNWLTTD